MDTGEIRKQDPALLLFTLYTAVVGSLTEASVLNAVVGADKSRQSLRLREREVMVFVRAALKPPEPELSPRDQRAAGSNENGVVEGRHDVVGAGLVAAGPRVKAPVATASEIAPAPCAASTSRGVSPTTKTRAGSMSMAVELLRPRDGGPRQRDAVGGVGAVAAEGEVAVQVSALDLDPRRALDVARDQPEQCAAGGERSRASQATPGITRYRRVSVIDRARAGASGTPRPAVRTRRATDSRPDGPRNVDVARRSGSVIPDSVNDVDVRPRCR